MNKLRLNSMGKIYIGLVQHTNRVWCLVPSYYRGLQGTNTLILIEANSDPLQHIGSKGGIPASDKLPMSGTDHCLHCDPKVCLRTPIWRVV